MHELLGQERKDWTCHPQLYGCQDFNPAVGLEDDISRCDGMASELKTELTLDRTQGLKR